MPEEKVGFQFEFGIKGDKEVKRGLEDVFRLMGSVPNAAAGVAGIAKSLGGLFELGKLAAPLGLAATAFGVFGTKAAEAGENLRQARYDIERLSRIPSNALSDSDLSGNMSSVVEEYKRLGIEAGNTFQMSFMDRLRNFGKGAYAVGWDLIASIHNLAPSKDFLFGTAPVSNPVIGTALSMLHTAYGSWEGPMPSYESISPEAREARKRVLQDQKEMLSRTNSDASFHNSKANADIWAGWQQAQVLSRQYVTPEMWNGSLKDWKPHYADALINGRHFGTPRVTNLPRGISPDSYEGMKRLREISREAYGVDLGGVNTKLDFEQKRLIAMQHAPLQMLPGTNDAYMAKRNQDISDEQQKINDLLKEQVEVTKAKLDLDLQDRQAMREAAAGINAGHLRSLGLGGAVTNWLGRSDLGDSMFKSGGRLQSRLFGGHGRVMNDLFGGAHNTQVVASSEANNTLKSIDSNITRLGVPTLRN